MSETEAQSGPHMNRHHTGPNPFPHRGGTLRPWSAALGAAALLALLAAPAAQAGRRHSLHGVVVHLRAADRATTRLTAHPGGPLAAMYLARISRQTALAAAVARSIAASAHHGASAERAATVLGLLADHQTSEAQALTSVLGDISPGLQAAVAQAISTATGGRGSVLGTLSGLLPELSSQAKPIVAQIVAMESSQGAQVPVELAGVLGGNSLACPATGAVQQALVVATQAFQFGLTNLGQALALVPAPVRLQVQSEIDGIPNLLRNIEDQLQSAVPCSTASSTAGPGSPAPVTALKTPTLIGGMTQLINGILGQLLPGLGAGQTPTPVAAPAPLTGLLGGFGTGLFGGRL